jgi:hypothetical protein
MTKPIGFFCATCGKHHDTLPMDVGVATPITYDSLPPEERSTRCKLTSDLCVIDGKEFFIRGCLEIPVTDGPGPFVYGVWVSLSEKNFNRYLELWKDDSAANEPSYFGWFCTRLPNYPDTVLLKTHVHLRAGGLRPLIELEPTDHPLAVEQQNGITMRRVHEIVDPLLHRN